MIVLWGLPGSGKTTVANAIRNAGTEDAKKLIQIVSSDKIRRALIDYPQYTADESALVFTCMHDTIAHLLGSGKAVISDATSLAPRHRNTLIRLSRNAGIEPIVVEVFADHDILVKRVTERDMDNAEAAGWSQAGLDVLLRMEEQQDTIKRYAEKPDYNDEDSVMRWRLDTGQSFEREARAMHEYLINSLPGTHPSLHHDRQPFQNLQFRLENLDGDME